MGILLAAQGDGLLWRYNAAVIFRHRVLSVLGVLTVLHLQGTHPLPAATLGEEIEAFLNVIAVAGREAPAADFIAGRLAGLPLQRDALGDVILTVGSGEPRRLLACGLGEPGSSSAASGRTAIFASFQPARGLPEPCGLKDSRDRR
ncbi:MAG TPA: hypothetical protein VLV54_20850 [Thermoanaerobaculia bacterium]|nr:hypothetical protein [Thermoanaerobaculia bacterium]